MYSEPLMRCDILPVRTKLGGLYLPRPLLVDRRLKLPKSYTLKLNESC